LEIWSFAASRMKLGCTSLTCDRRGPSSCSRLQDQSRIAYNTLMARRSQTPGISSTYVVSTLR
jgi:predicted ATPase